MLSAIEHSARIWVAAGAAEVATLQTSVNAHHVSMELRGKAVPGENEPLDKWLQAMRKAGLPRNGAMVFSAHQMGSCRMGVSPDESVVDENGKVWGVESLYVIDASVFPTASGANPMVTNLAVSHMVATRLAETLKACECWGA